MSLIDFAYCSRSDLSSKEANAIHVLQQCCALSEFKNIILISSCEKSKKVDICDLFDDYGLAIKFDIKELNIFRRSWGLHWFGFRSATLAKLRSVRYFYSRCEYAARYASLLMLPTYLEIHALPSISSKRKEVMWGRMLSSPYLLGVTAITQSLKSDFCKYFNYPLSKVSVLPDAASDPMDVLRPPALLSGSGKFKIGYVGNLYAGKGMEIISKLASLMPEVDFHVVGGCFEQVEYWAEISGRPPNLIFHGKVAPSLTGSYIQAFDIVLAPNQHKVDAVGGNDIGKWTSPLKLFEYMSHGKSIICSRLPVLQEVMIHEQNCLLADPCVAEDWVFSIKRLIGDAQLRMKLASRAREDFLSKYTWSIRASEIISLYQ